MKDHAIGWLSAGIVFVGVGLFQVVAAARLRPDHWVIRASQGGGPLNLIFRGRAPDPPGYDPIRNVRWSGRFFLGLGTLVTVVGVVLGLR